MRRIVREHGGEMAIESNEGKGLTFTIRLPYLDKRVRMLEAGRRTRSPEKLKEARNVLESRRKRAASFRLRKSRRIRFVNP